MDKFKRLLTLFFTFFKIGLFTFGGGYAMISVISHEVVEKKKYISEKEFSDVVAIAESTPGPIAINSSTYIGYRVAGIVGAIVASFAVCIPSFIIIYVISLFFTNFLQIELAAKAFKGIQCGVAVLIISAAFKLFKNVKKNIVNYILIGLSATGLLLVDIFSLNISTIFFVLFGMLVGIAVYFRPKKKMDDNQKNGDNGVIDGDNEIKEDEKEEKTL